MLAQICPQSIPVAEAELIFSWCSDKYDVFPRFFLWFLDFYLNNIKFLLIKMAASLVTRLILYEEIRKNYPKVETNSASLHFIEATNLTLAELLNIDYDDLSGSKKEQFDAEVNTFCLKVDTFMRKTKNKVKNRVCLIIIVTDSF